MFIKIGKIQCFYMADGKYKYKHVYSAHWLFICQKFIFYFLRTS